MTSYDLDDTPFGVGMIKPCLFRMKRVINFNVAPFSHRKSMHVLCCYSFSVLPYLQTINLQCRKRKHAVVTTGNVGCKAVYDMLMSLFIMGLAQCLQTRSHCVKEKGGRIDALLGLNG